MVAPRQPRLVETPLYLAPGWQTTPRVAAGIA
jgi:hypothetical protein